MSVHTKITRVLDEQGNRASACIETVSLLDYVNATFATLHAPCDGVSLLPAGYFENERRNCETVSYLDLCAPGYDHMCLEL